MLKEMLKNSLFLKKVEKIFGNVKNLSYLCSVKKEKTITTNKQ